ncbi:hypothetical protein ACFL3V_00125 [Nanoarchaeota archaeon]
MKKRGLTVHHARSMTADVLLTVSLTLILIVIAFNRLLMVSSWRFTILNTINTGMAEVLGMLDHLATDFPFNHILVPIDFWAITIISIMILLIGAGMKVTSFRDTRSLLLQTSRVLLISSAAAFIVIIILQISSAIVMSNWLVGKALDPATLPQDFIWDFYSNLFLAAGVILIITAFIKVWAKKEIFYKTLIITDTFFNSALVMIGYFILLRLILADVIVTSISGNAIKVMAVSGMFSTMTIALCAFIFMLSFAMRSFAEHLKDREHIARQLRDDLSFLKKHKEAKRIEVKTEDVKKHPAYAKKDHPIHRYIKPEGHYSKKVKRK